MKSPVTEKETEVDTVPFSYRINYEGKSKILKRIVDRLNHAATLGTTHDTAYYGDWGESAYEHSLIQEGNPHHVSLTDLGIANLPRKVEMILEAIGSIDQWITHAADIEYIVDHDGNFLVFLSASRLLSWH